MASRTRRHTSTFVHSHEHKDTHAYTHTDKIRMMPAIQPRLARLPYPPSSFRHIFPLLLAYPLAHLPFADPPRHFFFSPFLFFSFAPPPAPPTPHNDLTRRFKSNPLLNFGYLPFLPLLLLHLLVQLFPHEQEVRSMTPVSHPLAHPLPLPSHHRPRQMAQMWGYASPPP